MAEYPIQTDTLLKGSVIAANSIEVAFNVKRGTDAYQLAVMRAIDYIARRFADRGELVTVIQRRHDVVVLTDSEAISHNTAQRKNALRRLVRTHARQLGVDRSRVGDPIKLAEHDRELEVGGRLLSAISRVRREVAAATRQRQTPTLAERRKVLR